MSLLQVITTAAVLYFTVNFVMYLRSGELRDDLRYLRPLKVKKFFWQTLILNTGLIALVVFTYVALIQLYPPLFRLSWLLFFARPDEPAGANLVASGLTFPVFGVIFAILLALNIPRLARVEEEVFRDGTRGWGHALGKSLVFGLAHMVVGVPLAVGIALTIAGLWFTLHYKRGGLARSTAVHALWNWQIVALVALWMLIFYALA